MKINILVTIGILLLSSFICFGQKDFDNSSRSGKYGRITLTVNDLKELVSVIEDYYKDIPIDSLNGRLNTPLISCELHKDDKAVSFSSFTQINTLDIGDESYTEVKLYSWWKNKPISQVSFNFDNWDTRISVSGSDSKKVNALFRDLDDKLQNKKSLLSWINLNFVLILICWIILVASLKPLLVCFINLSENGFEKRLIVKCFFLFLVVVSCISLYVALMINTRLLPNFKLVQTDINWWDKYSGLLTLIGLLITLLTIGYNIITSAFHDSEALAVKPNSKRKKRLNS